MKKTALFLTCVIFLVAHFPSLSWCQTENWKSTAGGSEMDWANCVQQTPDGGFFVTGTAVYEDSTGNALYVFKTDSEGNVEWDQMVISSDWSFGEYGSLTCDGGYIITGYLRPFPYYANTDYIIPVSSLSS